VLAEAPCRDGSVAPRDAPGEAVRLAPPRHPLRVALEQISLWASKVASAIVTPAFESRAAFSSVAPSVSNCGMLGSLSLAAGAARCTPARDREALDVTLTEPEPGARKSEAGR
jgi:hypothetical protein